MNKIAAEEKPKEEKREEPKKASEPEKKAKKQVSAKLEKIVEEIGKLSVLELSQLVGALEEKLGVSAAPPVAAAPAQAPAAGLAAGAPGEVVRGEQATFNVVLTNAGANKISVIKAVREINQSLGLKEAKDLVEAVPKEILTGVNKKTADEAQKKLEGAGATVELK